MYRRALPVALLISSSFCAAWAGLVFEERHARFGDRYQGSTIEHRFPFSNTGTEVVTVVDTIAVAGTGEVSVSPRRVPPGGQGVATVRQPLARQLGTAAFRYALITDEPGADRYRFTLSGFVQSAYDPEAPSIDFGVVDRALGGTGEIELSSREVRALEARPAADLPDSIVIRPLGRAGPGGQGQRLEATLQPGLAPGLISGSFLLETNVAHQSTIRVFYRAHVVGDVVPSENPLQLGVTRIGEVLRKEITLESTSGRPVQIESVADTEALFDWNVETCVEGGDSCRTLVLSHAAQVPLSLVGKLQVHLAGEADPLTLNYRGIVVSADTVIRTLEVPLPGESKVQTP